MMHKELYEEFRRLEGQPVRIFTDDSRVVQGIVFCASDCATRILLENGDVALVDYAHIDTVEEPMMRLRRNFHQDVPVCLDGRCRNHCGGCYCTEDDDVVTFDEGDCGGCRDCRDRRDRFEGGCRH